MHFHILQPIDYVVYAWLFVAALSALYVGPLGVLLYVLADKEPTPGTHESFVAPLWKQAVDSSKSLNDDRETGCGLTPGV